MLRETAAKMGVVTQMGNQGTSENGLRTAVELIQSGGIGEVKEVHVWTNRPIWPQGAGRPAGSDPIPETLDWESWIGPAPMRPCVWRRRSAAGGSPLQSVGGPGRRTGGGGAGPRNSANERLLCPSGSKGRHLWSALHCA